MRTDKPTVTPTTFHTVCIEGQYFHGELSSSGPALRHGGQQVDIGQIFITGQAVCKYSIQEVRIRLSISTEGARKLAAEFGLTYREPEQLQLPGNNQAFNSSPAWAALAKYFESRRKKADEYCQRDAYGLGWGDKIPAIQQALARKRVARAA